MADCKIVRNSQGDRVGVVENNELFQSILSNAHVKSFDEALEIFKQTYSEEINLPRIADKLPLTLSIFDNKSFVEMRGKMVNPITVQQILNGGGIKQIEKDLINQIIEQNYKGQKKISFDELEATVRANIMPLERITTSSYSDYGMDNLGSGNYGEAKTLILNAPIEHGVTGHFSGDFKASGRQNIKYQPKQLDANTWVAVEEGYEANANDNNIYNYVGTAGTKEAVDEWIVDYSKLNGEWVVFEDQYYRGEGYLPSKPLKAFNTEEEANQWIAENKDNYQGLLDYIEQDQIESGINKGMFGHVRVWQDGQDYYVAELQSDYFQKNNAKKNISESKEKENPFLKKIKKIERDISDAYVKYSKDLEEIIKNPLSMRDAVQIVKIEEVEKFFADYGGSTDVAKTRVLDVAPEGTTYVVFDSLSKGLRNPLAFVKNFQEAAEIKRVQEITLLKEYTEDEVYKTMSNNDRYKAEADFKEQKKTLEQFKTENYKEELSEIKSLYKQAEEYTNKNLSPQEKQFIASQKIWEQRMVREAIKEASLSGATSLRFPTPYTLSVIEGYVSNKSGQLPYSIESSENEDKLNIGDTILFGETYLVIDANDSEIVVIPYSNISEIEDEEEFKNRTGISPIPNKQTPYESIRDPLYYLYDTEKEKVYSWDTTVTNKEFLGQPTTYNVGDKENFDISDLSDTQQTVARKYEEIAEILKKEKPVEVVTDENGFDWYEAPITQEDTQKPVVAFSISQQQPTLKYQNKKGQIFSTFSEALNSVSEGEINAGVNTIEGFKTLFTADVNSNLEVLGGMINNLIRQNLITGETYVDGDGGVFHKTVGNSSAKKALAAQTVKDKASAVFGRAVKTNTKGDVQIENNHIIVTKLDGTQETVSFEELSSKPFQTLKKEYGNDLALSLMVGSEYNNSVPTTNNFEPIVEEFIAENILQERVKAWLSKMGIKTLSLEAYEKNYETKNGIPVDAKGLAAIGEQLIAFKDGIIEEDTLLEETAHFIEASIAEEDKVNLLKNIHKTREWGEHAKTYEDVYKDDALLRKEILGKVIANSLKEQFAARNQNQTEDSIIAKIKELFDKFIARIQSLFQDSFTGELEQFNKNIYTNLMLEKLGGDVSLFKDNKFKMFNLTAPTSLYTKTAEALDLITAQQNQLAKTKNLSNRDLQTARELNASEDHLNKVKAILELARVGNNQISHLERAVESKKAFSQEENAVFQTAINHTVPLMEEIRNLLNSKNKDEQKVIIEIDNVLKKVSVLKGKVSIKEDTAIDLLVERVKEKHNLSDEDVEKMRKIIKATQTDTNLIHAWTGTLIHARNPLLNIAGDVIHRQQFEATQKHLKDIKALTQILSDKKIAPKKLKELLSKNGKYLISAVDYVAMEKDVTNQKVELYNVAKGTEIKAEDWNDSLLNDFTLNERAFYNSEMKKFDSTWKENFFTDKYINEQEELFKGLSAGYAFHKRDRAARAEIRNNATKDDLVVYNSNDKTQLEQLTKERVNAANAFTSLGDLKEGLIITYNAETKKDEFSLASNASDEAILAHDLSKINDIILKGVRDRKEQGIVEEFPQRFLDELNKIDSQEDKLEYLFLNSYVGFSDEYWNNFATSSSLVDKLRESIDEDNAEEIESLISNIRKQQSIVSRVLKGNRTFNRPSETNVENMHSEELMTVKEATQDLELLYRTANTFLPKTEQEEVEKLFTNTVNNSYLELLEDLGIETLEEEITEAVKYMTFKNKKQVEDAQGVANLFKKGMGTENHPLFTEDMSEAEIDETLRTYTRNKLLPYYKRTEPNGYSALLDSVTKGDISVEEFINNDLVQVNPNYSFYESSANESINANFLKNKAEGKPQIKAGKYVNSEYITYFGMSRNDDGSINEIPTKNKDMWEVYKAMIDLQKSTIDNLGLTGKQNLYKIPQVGKRGFRQFQDLYQDTSSRPWKEVLNDITQWRVDESPYGFDAQGNPIDETDLSEADKNKIRLQKVSSKIRANIIPMYYVRDLKDQKDVTDELLMSYSMMNQQSALYKARVENLGDMLALEKAIRTQEFKNGNAEVTKTYKMFKSFMEYNTFGVRETFEYKFTVLNRTFDIAKLASGFNNFVKMSGVSGVVVPLTSFLQGRVQRKLEEAVGERINPIASALARKEFLKLAQGAGAEMLGIHSQATLNVYGETYGTYKLEERLKNTDYGKGVRAFSNGLDFTHKFANFAVNPKVMLSVMMDNRFVEGKILNLNQFKKLRAGKSKDAIEVEWKSLDLLYPHISAKNGVQQFDIKTIASKLNRTEEDTQRYVNLVNEGISQRVKIAIQEIDSQISPEEKSQLARNALGNYLLTFRGWLTLAIQKKFKDRHLNFSSGEWEEGSFITAYNFMKKLTVGYKGSDAKSYLEFIKKSWQNADATERRNIKRTVLEVAFVNALFFVSVVINNMMDDDDEKNPWALSFANYMAYRVTGEQTSTTVIGMPKSAYEVLKSPLIGLDRVIDMKDWIDVFNSDEIETGSMAGETYRWRIVSRTVPVMKDAERMINIDRALDKQEFFQPRNVNWEALEYLFSTRE